MPKNRWLRSLALGISAIILPTVGSRPAYAQTVLADTTAAKRVLHTAELTFRNARRNRVVLDALGDSLVAIAVQPLFSGERAEVAANTAILRLGMAGSDPAVDYRGAVPRLLRIALEAPSTAVGRRAVSSLRSMTDTVAAVSALERLSTHQAHSFDAVLKLIVYYADADAGKAALRRLYTNRNAIPDALARDKLAEFVQGMGLVRKP